MKVSGVKVVKIARTVAVSLALGVCSVAFGADTLSDQQIVEKIRTHNAGQISQRRDLNYTPVQRSRYEGDTITVASNRNLGHLMVDWRKSVPAELTWLNGLQAKASVIDSDFVVSVAQQAYSAFDWVYSMATADAKGETLTSKADKVALQTWLAQTLVDYGIISEGYRQIYVSTEQEYSEKNAKKEAELHEKLKLDKEEKEKARSAKNQDFDREERDLTEQKTRLDSLAEKEKNPTRKGDTSVSIKSLEDRLRVLAEERESYNKSVDSEIAELDRQFELEKTKMLATKNEALQSLQDKYSYIFEPLGTSGVKTVLRLWSGHPTVRSEYLEFEELDKILSTKYPTLGTLARQSVLDELFALITPASDSEIQDTLRKSRVIKGLLDVSDEEYKQIIKRVHEKEVAKSKELEVKATDGAQAVKTVIEKDVSSSSVSDVPVSSTPSLTPGESEVVARVADAVNGELEKKKDLIDDANGSDDSLPSSELPLQPSFPPLVNPLLTGDYRLADDVFGASNTAGLRQRLGGAQSSSGLLVGNAASSGEARAVASAVTQPAASSSSAPRVQKKNKGGRGGKNRHR
ncbi:MAG: hypothetical protein KF820_02410 [Candidatus Paracaedibacteraceae bacterium]|nr:hypothetical protein [Candidatus Paracaedibacteraceae bacterium]